jgi:hypothetical protein
MKERFLVGSCPDRNCHHTSDLLGSFAVDRRGRRQPKYDVLIEHGVAYATVRVYIHIFFLNLKVFTDKELQMRT